MIFHSKKLIKFLVSSVLLVQSVIAFASISITENPSYDGSYEMVIPPSVWAGFDTANVTGDLYENGEHVADIYYSSNNRYYLVSGNPLGEYQYRLRVQGPFANSNGGAGGYEDFYADATVLPPLPPEPTENLNLTDFDIYYGDFNNDGLDGDIYFHQRDLFVLIAGDISIPLLLEQEIGFVIYRRSNSDEYSFPYLQRLNKEELTNYQKLRLNYDYFEGDINGDGKQDFFIRGLESFSPSVVALQTDIGFPEFVAPNINRSNSFDPSNRGNIIRLIDYNLDGRADLVLLSAMDGYVLDVIYTKSGGVMDENYYTVSSLDQIFNFSTYPANVTGTLAGKFRVSESGAATYSIPVFTPEGTAGVTPSVGMSYSSQGGNGIMGKGWSLNAFSAISRCRQTLDQDNNVLPVTWTSADRFCLDGQRLLAVSGTYGAADSTYRTEIDSQVIVKLHGNISGEPDYFSVIRKDGSITYYGLTSGMGYDTLSKQTFTAGKTMTWYQAVTTDNVGNPVRYFYKHTAGTDFRLDRNEYAYGATGTAATNEHTVIRFDYEKRPDIMQGYVAGQESRQQWRLKRIDVDNKVNSTVNVRTYHIFYNLEMVGNAATKRSLVGAIQECVRTSCKKATKFTWDLVQGQIDSSLDYSDPISTNDRPLMEFRQADFNGDGVLDLVSLHRHWDQDFVGGSLDSPVQYAISVDGKLTPTEFAEGGHMITYPENGQYEEIRIEPIDYNLDGRSDLAVYRDRGPNAGSWEIYLSVPKLLSNGETDWRLSKQVVATVGASSNSRFVDVNGDGLLDLVDGSDSGASAYILEPAYSNPGPAEYKLNTFYKYRSANSMPWTNIGLEHLPNAALWMWSEIPDGYEAYPWLSRGSRLVDSIPGDFNGDGLTDLIVVQERRATTPNYIDNSSYISSYRTFVLIQREGEYFEGVLELDRVDEPGLIKIGDINRDGLSDIYLTSESSGEIKLYTSTGHGFELPRVIASIDLESTYQLVDFDLDGFADIVEFRHNSEDTPYKPKVHLWNTGTQAYDKIVYANPSVKGEAIGFFMDVNSDGLNDFIRYQDKKLDTFLFASSYQKFEAISGIDTGSGAYTDISYEPLNNSEHYSGLDINPEFEEETEYCAWDPTRPRIKTCQNYSLYSDENFYYALNKGMNSSLSKLKTNTPTLEMNGPFQVVTRVTNKSPSSTLDDDLSMPDGIDGTGSVNTGTLAAVEYYYNEAKIQAGGRGFLGFHQLTTEDMQTGIKTSTIYRQDFPFIGSPLSTFVYAPNDAGLLSESHNVYEINGWPTDADSIAQTSGTAALGPILPFVRESVEVSYLTKSSGESGGAIELLQGVSTNIGGCVDDGPGCHPYLNQTTEQQISHRVITLNQVDNYGNALSTIVETTGDSLTQHIETSNEYGPGSVVVHGNTFSYAELGRLTKTTVTKTRNDISEPSQYSEFEYYDSASGFAGMLKKEISSPDGPDNEKLETTYFYNSLGLLRQKDVKGWDGTAEVTRSAETFYDATGRFVNYSEDALNHKLEEVLARNEYGAPTSIKAPNGAQVTKVYDAWGRETSTSSNSGGSVSTFYVFCSNSSIACPDYAKTAVIQRTSAANNAITAVAFYDLMGREIRAGSISFDGSMVYTDTEYDVVGRVVRKSLPYFASDLDGSHDWARTYYDVLGRPLMSYAPDGSIGKFEYDGYKHISINDLGQKKIETKNGFGELVEVEDELGGKITYNYNTDGSLSSTTGHKDNEAAYAYGTIPGICKQPTSNLQVVLCYDRLGRKTAMWDPDKGYWTYEYNAFGELIKQTNANGHYVETEFDILGRPIKRWDYKQGGALEGYTTWHYDGLDDEGFEVENSVLQTTAVAYSEGREHAYPTTPGPIDPSQLADYVTRNLFNDVGLPFATERLLPDGNIYRTEIDYDNEWRVEKEFDVLNGLLSRRDENDQNNVLHLIESGIQNHYNLSGFLELVTNIEDGKYIFEPGAYDEKGNLKTASLGGDADGGKVMITNGYDHHTGLLTSRSTVSGTVTQNFTYEWDTVGNLGSRTNQNSTLGGSTSLIEEFCYDALNRAIKSYETINTTGALTGPACPTSESAFDVTYDQLGNIKSKAGVGTYAYGEVDSTSHRAGPHALTSINGSATKYRYDKNGNLLNDGSRNFVYSTFDKPLTITKGSHTTRFRYGPSRSRFYREDNYANGTTERTWYLGNVEKVEKANGVIEWRRMLEGGVMHTYTTNSAYEISDLKKRYILKDHLGSSSLILEEQGANMIVAQSMSFDVWGQRRNTQNMQDLTATQLTNFDHSITTRGYTGHEMLDEVGTIHMNGRIYDPRLGRFLQADPHIQAPTDTQSYNRYSYVRNNPLNATDPTGYFFVPMMIGMAMGYMAQQFGEAFHAPWLSALGSIFACGSMGPGAIACAGGAGFGVTYGATGDFSKALESGLIAAGSAAAFTWVGGKFAEVSGPTCRVGSLAFAGNHLMPLEVVAQISAHAVLGGIAADLQGGKFAHGFVSAGTTKGVMGIMGMNWGGKYRRTLVAALVGGTTSTISGGKFANGAVTAAIGHLFNAENAYFKKKNNAFKRLVSSLTEEQIELYEKFVNEGGGLIGNAKKIQAYHNFIDSLNVQQMYDTAVLYGADAVKPGYDDSRVVNRTIIHYYGLHRELYLNLLDSAAKTGEFWTGFIYDPGLKGIAVTKTLRYLRWDEAADTYKFVGDLQQYDEMRKELFGE